VKRLHAASDWAARKLAAIFGFDLTIWIFFLIPLIAPLASDAIQAKVFYYSSGWVQFFALPLMVYVANKVQRTSDEQLAEIRQLSRENRELNREIRRLLLRHDDPPPSSG
jgi:hypothetical protein